QTPPRASFLSPADLEDNPKPIAQPDVGRQPQPGCRATRHRLVTPRAAPRDAEQALLWSRWIARRAVLIVILVIPVGTPLADVAVDVKEPEGVFLLLPDRGKVGGFSVASIRTPAVVLEGRHVPEAGGRGGTGPAGILPLGLGRQTVDTARRTLLGQARQLAT